MFIFIWRLGCQTSICVCEWVAGVGGACRTHGRRLTSGGASVEDDKVEVRCFQSSILFPPFFPLFFLCLLDSEPLRDVSCVPCGAKEAEQHVLSHAGVFITCFVAKDC